MSTAYRSTYDNGLPFTGGKDERTQKDLIAINLDDIRERRRKKKASMILIDGSLGEGKTTLAVHLAEYIQGSPIDLKVQLAMGGKDLMKKLQDCYVQGYGVLIYDEAGDYDKAGALTKFNKMLNRVFDTYRAFNIILIVVLPNFSVLSNRVFDNGLPRQLYHCYDRDEKYGHMKGYSLKTMLYMRDYMKKEVVKNKAYTKFVPNLYGEFLNLSPARSAELDKLSTKSKLGSLQQAEITHDGLKTVKDVAEGLGRTDRWVRLKTKTLGIQPAKILNGKNYYTQDTYKYLQKQTREAKK